MTIILPVGWVEHKNADTGVLSFQKTYSDGLDVLLSIELRDNAYELWSSAENRCSGPSKHKDSIHQTIESAVEAALVEMHEWDSE
ncbi:hypothetical protein ACS82_00080 [Vibrio parahaemolyticus]|uniref:hypothetical protein n=1 Tax=Vibrio parahaemolyticus TaxID=670 RepID=UPI0006A62842|nr:hypothetical protein [Vibrio parahaemolyticus]KOE07360.1 hypothetical protein ACS82_00080 [Vibrio parahaemolyticus]